MSLTTLINSHHSTYADAMASLVTTPFVWLPLVLMLALLIIRGNKSMTDILRIFLMLLLCVVASHIAGYALVGIAYGTEGPAAWALRNGIIQTAGARQYGLYSLLTSNAMSVAVFVSLLIRHRRLTLTLLFWAMLNAWAVVYMGADSVEYELLCLSTGAVFGLVVWFLHRFITRKETVTEGSASLPDSTPTGYPSSYCRLVVCAAAFLFLLITFLPVIK